MQTLFKKENANTADSKEGDSERGQDKQAWREIYQELLWQGHYRSVPGGKRPRKKSEYGGRLRRPKGTELPDIFRDWRVWWYIDIFLIMYASRYDSFNQAICLFIKRVHSRVLVPDLPLPKNGG